MDELLLRGKAQEVGQEESRMNALGKCFPVKAGSKREDLGGDRNKGTVGMENALII